MASDKDLVEYIADQLGQVDEVTVKKMFGDYGVFSGAKIFALICDNKLFIKPTDAGREFIKGVVEAPPYPGAKPYFLIEEQLEDRDWLGQLVKITIKALPEPKPKKRKPKI